MINGNSSNNRTTSRRNNGSGMNIKSLLLLVAIAVILWFIKDRLPISVGEVLGDVVANNQDIETSVESDVDEREYVEKSEKDNIEITSPTSSFMVNRPSKVGKNQIVKHKAFELSYNETHEQADWVFYLLTREFVNGTTGRTNDFRPDPDVTLCSAAMEDYTGSGYDRGHLCPAADMRINEEIQSETFFMSNVSPQVPAFDQGIWRKLEEQARAWVRKHDSIWVATGPVLKNGLKKIGRRTKISVPDSYYKILFSPQDGGHMIGFLLPNDECIGNTYDDFIVSVDDIESATGINFFPNIKNEDLLESKIGTMTWWNKRSK